MNRNIITILYYLLVLICVGISTYLSYFGYKSSFGGLTLPFVAILAIGLFAADILIRDSRVSGKSMMPPLLLFALFAFFSAVSNFNFLYTTFMQNDVVNQTLAKQYIIFRTALTDTRTKLTQLDAFTFTEQKRIELDRELARLRTQIFDDLRPGCGERCRSHLAQIEQILGKPLTDFALPQPGASETVMANWFERVRDAALADFNKLTEKNSFPELDRLIQDIDNLLLKYDTPQRLIAQNQGLSILQTLAKESGEIERRANALLPATAPVTHPKIDPTLGRLGEIVYSLQNGFVDRPNIGATAMSSILAIVIDIFPIMFALVAFAPGLATAGHQPKRRGRAGTIID
ncbi:hypothetical protein F2Q65_17385 [Thiohalocapsa marina]|uniref:Uncharacterized protein n=1 Tax=Thiohalocapsa marina TaxID=424902 RepID=A0A5M8FJV9_9GAMM|nr:hypothetical protein [Thiohalocapsa marina]KAA6182745.1 hypothetical protein F2Q65_17385 [Thiohalocapsa marina]